MENRMAKKIWVTVLGILNFIACGSLLVFFYMECYSEWRTSYTFTWGLPILLAAILAFICGVFTIIKKRWAWVALGFIIAGIGWAYYLILWGLNKLSTMS
jgi:hypothetical protein